MHIRVPALFAAILFSTTLITTPISAQHGPQPATAHRPSRNLQESGPAPRVTYASELAPVPFELFRGSRMFMNGTINGVGTQMMLDSGASMTVLDTAFARKIGVKGDRQMPIAGAAGSSPGEIASNVSVGIGPVRLDGSDVIIMDLAPIASAIGRPIPVILGHDALEAGPVTIDFQKRFMQFTAASRFKAPAGATKVALGWDGPFRAVKIGVAGSPPINATLDIGNGGTIVLAKSYWKDQRAIATIPSAETQIGGVGGMKIARKTTLPWVEFGGQRLAAVPAFMNEDPKALPTEGANLGIEMLKPFVVTLDYAHDTMYLQPAGKWPGFSRERAGIGTHLIQDRLKVTYVSPDGPGSAAGIKAGDEIVAVDGTAVSQDYFSGPHFRWAEGAPGTKVALKRADGSTVTVTLSDYY